ncbi:MAG: prenyltransferase [Deltaproteobacteria bacterium]|nr:prenyltransferase [Deltaproteobacteria bacterium]
MTSSARPGSLRAWVRALRPLAHGNLAPPILLGQALALHEGHEVSAVGFLLAHVFGVIDHAFIVLANDLADHETDRDNTTHTLVSGGSRVVPEGLLTLEALARGAWIAGAALLVLTIVAALLLARPLAPLFALAAIGLLLAYSHPPMRLSYRGGGEILQGLGLGAVLPLWGFYAQVGSLDRFPWIALAPVVLLHTIGNVITALPDAPSDARAHKRTWPVRVGERAARGHVIASLSAILVGFAIVIAARQTWTHAALVVIAPLISLAISTRWLAHGDAAQRDACLRFVLATAGALGLVQLGWCLALALG